MKNELKNYRIVSENGDAMLITREHFNELLQTLDRLADKNHARPERKQSRKNS